MNHRVALVSITAIGGALAAPAVSGAQAPSLPVPAPPALSVLVPLPPGASTDPVTGVVTTVTGVVLGVLDPVTGQIVPGPAPAPPPASPPPAPETETRPAPAQASTPSKTGPTSATPDTTRPRLQIRVDRHTSNRIARRRGIRVVARCNETCTATLRMVRGRQLGRKRVKLTRMRTYVMRVKLNRRGRAVTARARTATKLHITGRAVDAAGNRSSTVKKTAYVRAGKRR